MASEHAEWCSVIVQCVLLLLLLQLLHS